MRLNLPPQKTTDRLREPYHAYLLEFILTDKKPEEEPVLRTIETQGNAPLPDKKEQSTETVLKVQSGGSFGHIPGDPSPVCPGSRGGVCSWTPGAAHGGRNGRR
ncbi:hypothetical protein [Streptomyces sp. NPDC002491]